MSKLAVSVAIVLAILGCVAAHGTVHDPVARQTRWRYDSQAPANFDDVGLWCGGFQTQWNQNGGRCGVCGDNFADRQPRAHELGGTFGQGVIVRNYQAGNVINVNVQVTANHRGHFVFELCNLDRSGETDACFEQNRLRLASGEDRFVLPHPNPDWFNVALRLPAGLRCQHCVLRWTYIVGNNWGQCADGSGALGCGPQEHFRSCSDIRVN